jgi:hypothetical protein
MNLNRDFVGFCVLLFVVTTAASIVSTAAVQRLSTLEQHRTVCSGDSK